ncbi:hypothetical protein ACFWM1_31965 [Nocardia sp. NPDC058379]|uniref:hypothetical protein n=1 Tax=unclassified Nocardia TaxID=2637762 RepID=UPI00366807CA
MIALRKTWIGVVAGVTLLLAGCGGDGPRTVDSSSSVRPSSVTSTSRPPVIVPPSEAPVTSAPPVTRPPVGTSAAPTSARTTPPPTPATGTVVLRTATLSGVPVPGVPVRLSLQQPCDPAGHDIPVGETTETQRQEGVTDAAGLAVFTAATGCYHFGMTAPAGTNPVPEGMHSLFLVEAGATVTGNLRFQDTAPAPACAEATVETELGVDAGPVATISHCDGRWAVVSWDSPGDNQRIITRATGTWATYVQFPHDTCWAEASAAGVPDTLRHYFSC